MKEKIQIAQACGEFGKETYFPMNEGAIYACYLTGQSLLTSKHIKALKMLGHNIELVKKREKDEQRTSR